MTFIDVTFQNMSEEYAMSAILITYASSNQSVIPAFEHSNQCFINSLNAGKTTTVRIPVVINDKGDGYAYMSFNIEYSVDEIGVFSSSSYIVFPVRDESISVRNINVTKETTIGVNTLVSVSFDNLLKTDMLNAKLIISGDVNDGEITYNIGNVAARSTKYAEYYFKFESAGEKEIKLQISYTLDNGETVTKDIGDYNITVKQGSSANNGGDPNGGSGGGNTQQQTGIPLNLSTIFLGLAGALLLITATAFVVSKIRDKQ